MWAVKTELKINTTTTTTKTEVLHKEMFILSPLAMKSQHPAKKQNGSVSTSGSEVSRFRFVALKITEHLNLDVRVIKMFSIKTFKPLCVQYMD